MLSNTPFRPPLVNPAPVVFMPVPTGPAPEVDTLYSSVHALPRSRFNLRLLKAGGIGRIPLAAVPPCCRVAVLPCCRVANLSPAPAPLVPYLPF